jgi:tetraacyldisaccharide 4'-kinase
MDEPYFIDAISGKRRGLSAAAVRAACGATSWGYAAAISARNLAYDLHWFEVGDVDASVISIGNLTAGGTGKTPLAALLAQKLLLRGLRPGIVSRGYRRLNDDANDEQLMLQQLVPGVPQVLNRDRVAGAQTALADHGCDVILLDDGFQHRRLYRDLDLVLIDATRPWGYGHLLPRGLLREPLSSLWRADVILLTRCDQVSASELDAIRAELFRWRGTAECVTVRFAPRRLRNAAGEIRPLSELSSRRCLPFCGIGNPDGFRRTLAELKVCAAPMIFPDHHHYQPGDFQRLAQRAETAHAEWFVTTQKDLVKIPQADIAQRPVWAIEIGAEIVSGAELLDHALAQTLPAQKSAA